MATFYLRMPADDNQDEHWLPLSVDGAGPTEPDPSAMLDSSPTTAWFSRHLPVILGQPLIIDRGSDTSAFNNVVVTFGAALTGQTGTNPNTLAHATRFQVLVSSDQLTWTWVASAYAADLSFSVTLDPAQNARYVQIALMDYLLDRWTVTNISLLAGGTTLPSTGWTVSTAQLRTNGGTELAVLRLDTTNGWVAHLPPASTYARPLQLKMPDKSLKTVMSMGARDYTAAPNVNSCYRHISIDEITGTRSPDVVGTNFTTDTAAVYAYPYSQWIRQPVNGRPTGDQVVLRKEHHYQHSTFWFLNMAQLRSYWSGFPVKKMRFGFQIESYFYTVWHGEEKPTPPSPGTFLLYRESVVPPVGVPPLAVSGTPIHTFNPVTGWPTGLADGETPEFHRGEMFWYEIDPVWHDLAFTLCTMWQAIDVPPPLLDPSTGAQDLPSLADGQYEYRTIEWASLRTVFQIVLDN